MLGKGASESGRSTGDEPGFGGHGLFSSSWELRPLLMPGSLAAKALCD
jgi:hypothetical protein